MKIKFIQIKKEKKKREAKLLQREAKLLIILNFAQVHSGYLGKIFEGFGFGQYLK